MLHMFEYCQCLQNPTRFPEGNNHTLASACWLLLFRRLRSSEATLGGTEGTDLRRTARGGDSEGGNTVDD